MKTAIAAVLAGSALFAGSTASAGNVSWHHAGILGVVPHAGVPQTLAALGATSPNDVSLHTNPCDLANSCWVMRTNTVYAIYWVPAGSTACGGSPCTVDSSYESAIDQYFTDVAADSGSSSNVYSDDTQYYDATGSIAYDSTFGGAYVDTDAFPANGCTNGAAVCLDDNQLEHEIENVIAANAWPDGETSLFFIMTPAGVGSCYDAGGISVVGQECTSGTPFDDSYCAYHSGTLDTHGQPIVYAVEPYDATISGCSSGNSPNGDQADATINTIAHEQNESITDPWGNAWYNDEGDEIADLCAWEFGTALGHTADGSYNQVINGDYYWLQMMYSNDGSDCVQRYSPSSPYAPTEISAPVVSGTAAVGKTLSTSTGSWNGSPTGYTYQWERCSYAGTGCANIAGATSSQYQLAAADAGGTVRSEVTAQNNSGTSTAAVSAPSDLVVPVPALTAAPAVSGVAAVGKTLSVTTGTWNATVTAAYQWLRCSASGGSCSSIGGATSSTYVVKAADAGHELRARISATNAAATTAATSAPTAVVVAKPKLSRAPHVSGKAKVGRRLSATKGTWTSSPTRYRYTWLRCNATGGSCAAIRGATGSTYVAKAEDKGHRLRVRVTAANAAGSVAGTSGATARVTR